MDRGPQDGFDRGTAAELGWSDIDAVIDAVSGLAAVRPLDDLRRDTVEIVAALVTAQLVSWNEVDLVEQPPRSVVVMTPDLSSVVTADRLACLHEAFQAHIGEHPAIRHFQATGDGRPRTISDFLSEDDFHASALYQTFYGQPEIMAEDQLSLTLPQTDLVVGIALNRPGRDFTDRDRAVLNLLRPPLVQAHRNASALERAGRIVAALEKAVETDGEGLVLLSRGGQVEHVTPRARELLGWISDGIDDRPVPAELLEWMADPSHANSPAWPLVREGPHGQVLVRRLSQPEGVALLLSVRPTGQSPAVLQRLGLSPRQAEVMALVAQGTSTKNVATALGISPRTVDKHVEHSLRTLGATTRIAAVNLIHQSSP